MRALRARVLVAVDATGVAGASVSGGPGPPRIRSFARAPLPPGALVPGPFDPNVVGGPEVERALSEVAAGVEGGRGPVALILPEGVARTALLDVPAGVTAREVARYRITAGAPVAPGEALGGPPARLSGGGCGAAGPPRALRRDQARRAAALARLLAAAH